jgi:hypothetical protein
MHLKGRDAEAESLIRETLAFHEKVGPDHWRTCYWKSVLGVILLGQRRYAEAEPLILKGYLGMKEQEATQADETELGEAGERIVRFYEVTNQPEKAREWREKIGVRAETKLPPKTKEAQPKLFPSPGTIDE